MQKRYCWFVLLAFCLFGFQLKAQDHLTVPTYNPNLLNQTVAKKGDFSPTEKLNVLEDSLIYQYDTLSLPFLDDFSSDHLSKRVEDINDPRVNDTTVYRIYQGGQVVQDTNGFVRDSTFYYQYGADSSLLQKVEQFNGIVEVHNLSTFPTTTQNVNVYLPYNIYDTVGDPNPDTIFEMPDLFQDSANYYFVAPDSNDFYVDRSVYINRTFAIDPPTFGVATFDGLTEYGLPYNIDQQITVKADYLTSLPIDLSFTLDTTYFSFFFEPQGISLDGPEREDSLVLEFYNSNREKWGKVWGTPGFDADTFQQVFVRVDSQFLTSAFQFRFRAYANSAGAFDQWHIDYLYLNDQREASDKSVKDIAFTMPAPSLLKDYTAMPWWHFKPNPGAYMADSVNGLRIKSLFQNGLNVFNKIVIPDTVNNSTFFRFPASDQFSILSAFSTIERDYLINFDFDPNYIDTAGTLAAIADIDFRPSQSQDPDLIRANDTVRSEAVLDNYYAYDDGTAEAGYGVNPQTSADGLLAFMAVEFNMPFADTVGGVQLYFLPQRFNFDNPPITSQSFQLTLWNSLNPAQIVYQQELRYRPFFSDDNGYVTFWLDTLIPVNQTFFVGFKAIGPKSMNIGYDLNTNHRDKIFWSLDGASWSNPSRSIFDGSLMLRPVFRKKNWDVGVVEPKPKYKVQIDVYPNPARELISIRADDRTSLANFQLFNLKGQLMREGVYQKELDVSNLDKGVYLLRLISKQGKTHSRKIMIAD